MDATTITPGQHELVILVHGTYAASTSDQGEAWWQCGSRAWKQLAKKLPCGTRLAGDGEVFHWSGENSERARSKAGRNLLARITNLEKQGRSYHLVGHSHGGSVIWCALRQATLRRQELKHLGSWSTVGTPFLKHRTRGAWHLANIVNIMLAIVLLRPALHTLRKLIQLFGSALFGLDEGIVITNERVPMLTRAVRGPLLKLLESLGISVNTTNEGIQLGSFDPAAGRSFFEYLFFSVEGWVILGVTLLCVYVFLNLAMFFLSPVIESLQIRQEARLERKVMTTYQGRWLGLWSKDDEAINGLRTTLDVSMSFVQRMGFREAVFFSDRLFWVSRPYQWILVPIYNTLLRPLLDGVIRSHIVKTALGNNRPAAEVVAVSTVPGPPQSNAAGLPALPEWLCGRITSAADQQASHIAPQLRCLLAEPTFASGLEKFSGAITGRELVHTSYFDHPEVIEVLAAHVSWGIGNEIELPDDHQEGMSLTDWFTAFKAELGRRVSARPALLRPRRAA